MKKSIKYFAIVAFAVFAGYGIYTNQKVESVSELLLANVEALAGDENSGVDCCCGLIWGTNCRADNYGASCTTGGTTDCSKYDSNCD